MMIAGAELTDKMEQFNASQSNTIKQSNLDADVKVQLGTMEADYKILMQSNASAAEIYKTAIKNISDIAANKDMSAEAKNTAVNNQMVMLQSGLTLVGDMANLDLSGYITFDEDGNSTGVTTTTDNEETETDETVTTEIDTGTGLVDSGTGTDTGTDTDNSDGQTNVTTDEDGRIFINGVLYKPESTDED
jgi:hypothetical protein